MMPSKYTSDESLEDAEENARLLGCRHDVISIAPAVEALDAMLPDLAGLAAENVQARLRMVTLMALSNSGGQMLLTTGNKSEMSVGYATLYGDMAGGYSVLKDAYKTTVFAAVALAQRQQAGRRARPGRPGDAAADHRQAAFGRAAPQPEGRGQPAALCPARPHPRGSGRAGAVGARSGRRRPAPTRHWSPRSRRSCCAPNISAARRRPASSSAAATSAATAATPSPTPSILGNEVWQAGGSDVQSDPRLVAWRAPAQAGGPVRVRVRRRYAWRSGRAGARGLGGRPRRAAAAGCGAGAYSPRRRI